MTQAGTGVYAYGVVSADARPLLTGQRGVDPSFPVRRIRHRDLGAVVSRVHLGEFGSEPLKRNLEDLDWLARVARAHNAVLDRLLVCEAVVPLRLCTIFAGMDGVRDTLEGEHGALLDMLGRVRGHTEWSVTVVGAESAGSTQASVCDGGGEAAPGEAPGHAFFARRRLQRTARERARAVIECAVEEIDERLRVQASAATRLRSQDRRLSGRPGEMLLNAAYLVERLGVAAFVAVAEELAASHREIGLTLEVNGPFAPYSFVSDSCESA
jgi:Gas vesicle synthesis protein GvpL/GvpF